MNSVWLILIATICFVIAYLTYAQRLADNWGVNNNQITPAHEKEDGIDYVPAKSPVLLGHHFASIAGAAPIIGPVTAAVFGWLPVFLWIVLGSIFIGAVHDMGSIFSSIRHGGRSIAQVIDKTIGRSGKQLFSIFAWLTLILVIAAFMNVTADAFVSTPEAATASILFIGLALVFGIIRQRSDLSLPGLTVIGVALLMGCIYLGVQFPIEMAANTWMMIFVVYIFIASVTPVWILLQPRDYLNSFLLYGILIGSFLGIVIGGPGIEIEGFTSFQTDLGYLFPILFVTVACGAISGFHSLVASGTTSKQLDKEEDTKIVGFGAMLIEGLLAVIALIAAAVITSGEAAELIAAGGPVYLFANGVGSFLATFGIPFDVGVIFGSLTVAAFAMTTLDTATRLARFIFQEYFVPEEEQVEGQESSILGNMYFATLVTVVFAAALGLSGAWADIWPIFGSANQLLASLALLSLAVWLAERGLRNLNVIIPMVFMFAVTLSALVFVAYDNIVAGNYILAILAVVLFVLAVVLVKMASGLLTPQEDPGVRDSGN